MGKRSFSKSTMVVEFCFITAPSFPIQDRRLKVRERRKRSYIRFHIQYRFQTKRRPSLDCESPREHCLLLPRQPYTRQRSTIDTVEEGTSFAEGLPTCPKQQSTHPGGNILLSRKVENGKCAILVWESHPGTIESLP